MDKIYFRSNLDPVEEEQDSRTISGVAVVFNKWSRDLGGFKERILPGAITEELVNTSDVIANTEHDSKNHMMARSKNGKGTLKLELKEDGLHFSFDAPLTDKGDELLYHVRNGNVDECSFAFSVPVDGSGEKWYKDQSGNLLKDINKISGLYDISIVAHAAYGDTYCYSERTLDIEMVKKSEELNNKYDALMEDLHKYCIE